MTQISILGCGWLGFPLAKDLLKEGFSINGSTTSTAKLSVFETSGINPFLISLSEEKPIGDFTKFLENSTILIIAVPPRLRSNATESFVEKIKNCIPFIERSSIKKMLFISSTAVYGKIDGTITEEATVYPVTESGRQLVEIEKLLQRNPNFETSILRFGGLIGENRHPARFLAGKTNLENPDAPINLIQLEDCIGIIQKIIEQEAWNEIFNAVTPFHPSRKEYYTQQALELGLPIPEFLEEATTEKRIISSSKIITELGYLFKKPNL